MMTERGTKTTPVNCTDRQAVPSNLFDLGTKMTSFTYQDVFKLKPLSCREFHYQIINPY